MKVKKATLKKIGIGLILVSILFGCFMASGFFLEDMEKPDKALDRLRRMLFA